jgi:2-isopropylmalate synthase
MFTQGVDPELDISNIDELRAMAEYCNQLPVHPRHPYAGDLVYTAFSGSHQDAIKKGMAALKQSNSGVWEVPYLPIDPQDVGRNYEAIIRINSQSGKGGVAYILENEYHLELPRGLQIEFTQRIQDDADTSGKEISPEHIWQSFQDTYLSSKGPIEFIDHRSIPDAHASEQRVLTASLKIDGSVREITGRGNGPIAAYTDALQKEIGVELSVLHYYEHSTGSSSDATAVAYVEVKTGDGRKVWGVGRHPNIVKASLLAVTSAANQIGNPA